MRGKTVTFTRTGLAVPPGSTVIDEFALATNPDSTSAMNSLIGYYLEAGTTYIAGLWTDEPAYLYSSADGWLNTTFSFPDTQDYFVYMNTLPAHRGDGWGFDYGYVTQ